MRLQRYPQRTAPDHSAAIGSLWPRRQAFELADGLDGPFEHPLLAPRASEGASAEPRRGPSAVGESSADPGRSRSDGSVRTSVTQVVLILCPLADMVVARASQHTPLAELPLDVAFADVETPMPVFSARTEPGSCRSQDP